MAIFVPDPTKGKKDKKEYISALIFGESGIGKTFMAETSRTEKDSTLFFSADGNTTDVKSGIINLVEPQEIDEKNIQKAELFRYYLEKLLDPDKVFTKELQELGYKTIVIDTVDHIAEWEENRIVKNLGLNDKSEDIALDHKKGAYRAVNLGLKGLFIAMIEAIKYDFNLILISFESKEEFRIPGSLVIGEKYVSSIKITSQNSSGLDKVGIYDAIKSRLFIVGRIFNIDEKDENGNTIETKKAFNCVLTPTNEGLNRYDIKTLISPTWQAIQGKVKQKTEKEEKNGK